MAAAATEGEQPKPTVMAWSTQSGKRYLLAHDSCYKRYKQFLGSDAVTFFASPQEAETAGFQRKAVGVVRLKKYADVCSPLYEYASSLSCEKVFLTDQDEARRNGFIPLEDFATVVADVEVVGVVRSKTYLTPCDEGYDCLTNEERKRTPECTALASSTGKVHVFGSERTARKEGYRSVAEVFYSELDENF
jgi:hypothetical protein